MKSDGGLKYEDGSSESSERWSGSVHILRIDKGLQNGLNVQ